MTYNFENVSDIIHDDVFRFESYSVRCIAEDVFGRIDEDDINSSEYPEELVYDAIDDALIYNGPCWDIIMNYCNPTECSWEEASERFREDCLAVLSKCEYDEEDFEEVEIDDDIDDEKLDD